MEQQNIDPPFSERFFTIREIADILRIDPDTVEDLIREQRLRAVKVGKRSYRVPLSALDAFIHANSTIPPPANSPQAGEGTDSTQQQQSCSDSDGQQETSHHQHLLILS